MANIITELHLEMSDNWYVLKKLNSIGRVGENTVTKLIIEPTEILDNVTYEIEIADASGSKNVAELTIDGTELYLILTANMLTTSGITKMQVRGLFADGSIKKSNIFELKVNRSISATEHYEEYAVTIFDQLVNECRDIIEGAESYAVRAETAAVNAEAYEQSASVSAEAASASEATATSASTAAVNAATSAESASTSAHTSAETATTAASSASTSAANASTSATNAANSATSAATSATNAHNSAVNASTSETNASTSAAEAEASAESIAASVAQINENTYRINDLEAIIAGYQLTDLPTGAVASITDGTALLMPSLKVGIEPVQSGSGDPSPENIRPISGWTAANVMRSGKNLFDKTAIENNKWLNISTGEIESSASYAVTAPIKVEANKTITMTFPYSSRRWFYDNNGNAITLIQTNTFTPSQDGYIRLTLALNNVNLDTFQIELGSTTTTYEPYSGQTYTIEFKDGDNPLTVYGGTLDVTTGELIVYRVLLYADGSFNVANVAYDSSTQLYYTIIKVNLEAPTNNPFPQSDKFKPYASVNIGNCYITNYGKYLLAILPDQSADTVAKATQWFANNPTQFVYELATPITYQLTPTQVRTLVGNNNICVDTGNIIEGKYFKSLV